jgi:hypothetical protein
MKNLHHVAFDPYKPVYVLNTDGLCYSGALETRPQVTHGESSTIT